MAWRGPRTAALMCALRGMTPRYVKRWGPREPPCAAHVWAALLGAVHMGVAGLLLLGIQLFAKRLAAAAAAVCMCVCTRACLFVCVYLDYP